MRNVKERGLAVGSAPQVLLHDASVLAALVQDRQLVSRKGHHVTAKFLVKVVECGLSEGFVGGGSGEGALGHRSTGGRSAFGADERGGGSRGGSTSSSSEKECGGGRTHCQRIISSTLMDARRRPSLGFDGTAMRRK